MEKSCLCVYVCVRERKGDRDKDREGREKQGVYL